MTPIIGILASSATSTFLGNFESIATASGTGSADTITFSNIPSTYQHLQIRYMAQTARATFPNDALGIQFNSDTGSNYSVHRLRVSESTTATVVGTGSGSDTSINLDVGTTGAAGGSAAFWGVGVIDILDYKDTNKYKIARILAGCDNNTAVSSTQGVVGLYSGNWRNTNAITSITLRTPATGANFVSGTRFYLYGIK